MNFLNIFKYEIDTLSTLLSTLDYKIPNLNVYIPFSSKIIKNKTTKKTEDDY